MTPMMMLLVRAIELTSVGGCFLVLRVGQGEKVF